MAKEKFLEVHTYGTSLIQNGSKDPVAVLGHEASFNSGPENQWPTKDKQNVTKVPETGRKGTVNGV